MNQQIIPERECLCARCSGEFSLPEAKAHFLVIAKAAVQHQKSKVLVDVRQVHGSPTTWERYFYSSFLAETLAEPAHRLNQPTRLVYVGEIPLIDTERFGETVARNRGVDVKVYEAREIKDACFWLEITPPDSVLDSGP